MDNSQFFSKDQYVTALVQFFDSIEYRDTNYDDQKRLKILQIAFETVANHFAQLKQQDMISFAKINSGRAEKTMRTAVLFTVYLHPFIPLETLKVLAILWTYVMFLDNWKNFMKPESYLEDIVNHKQQNHS